MSSSVKKILIIIALAFLLSIVIDVYRLLQQSPQAIDEQSFTSIKQSLHQADLQKPILIYAWASWCGLCSITTPQVELVQSLYPTTSIAIQSGDDNKVQQYITNKNITLPVINDSSGSLASSLNIQGTPTFIIVSPAGKVYYYSVGVSFLPSLLLKLFIISTLI